MFKSNHNVTTFVILKSASDAASKNAKNVVTGLIGNLLEAFIDDPDVFAQNGSCLRYRGTNSSNLIFLIIFVGNFSLAEQS